MLNVSFLIGGQDQAAHNGATFDRRNAETGEIVSRSAAAGLDDADASVSAAQAAFPEWAALAPNERRRRLMNAADILERRTLEFITVGTAETGGTADWYGLNVHLAAAVLREAAAMTTQIGGEVIPSNLPGNISMAVRQPCGVVLGIAPWNAPRGTCA